MEGWSLLFKGNRDMPSESPPTGSPTAWSVLKRPDRSPEEPPPGSRKRRRSRAGACPTAASPEEPQEVRCASSFLLKESDTVFSRSKISTWFFFCAETCCFAFCLLEVCL